MAEMESELINVDSDTSSDTDCEIISEIWSHQSIPVKRLHLLVSKGYTNIYRLIELLFDICPSNIPSMPLERIQLLLSLLSMRAPPSKLNFCPNINAVTKLIENSKKILILTGAGISVSCGIPDFRSKDGIYSRLAVDYPDLKSPQSMFDITYFQCNPKPFFNFAKEICPGQFSPSIAHRFIALLESKDKLLRNYTQNIDTLEQETGINKVIQCHGSFNTAKCLTCFKKYKFDDIREEIMNQRIPKCQDCLNECPKIPVPSTNENETKFGCIQNLRITDPESPAYAVVKPEIVFFGEDLPKVFHETLMTDLPSTDLVIVMGSSLKVRPVASIPNSISAHVPQILINRESLSNNSFDIELLGDCDVILSHLAAKLDWKFPVMTTSHGKTLDEVIPTLLEEVPYRKVQSNYESKIGAKHPRKMSQNDENEENKRKKEKVDFEEANSMDNTEDNEIIIESGSNSSDSSSDSVDPFSISDYLPKNSYCLLKDGKYVFPGAEIETSSWDEYYLAKNDKAFELRNEPVIMPTEEERKASIETIEENEKKFMENLLLKCSQDPACKQPDTSWRDIISSDQSDNELVIIDDENEDSQEEVQEEEENGIEGKPKSPKYDEEKPKN